MKAINADKWGKMMEFKTEKKFVSLVIYLHNNGGLLFPFLDQVLPVFEKGFEQFELVCVDDACTDETMELLKDYVEDRKLSAMVSVVHMSFFQGLESGMNAGRDIAIGDFVYEFDDLTVDYDPELILEVYRLLLEGNDIVAAGREGSQRLTSRLFYFFYNRTSRGAGKIGPETFRLISRRAINRIKSMGQYIPYRKAVYMNCGLGAKRITYAGKGAENKGKWKKQTEERANLAFDSFVYFTNALEKISAVLSGCFLLATILVGIYIIHDAISSYQPVEGWMSTMGFLALGFFGVFALLTIILKYLSVLLNLIFRQQRYLVADIEKIVRQ